MPNINATMPSYTSYLSPLGLVSYIVYSFVRRLPNNTDWLWIPICLNVIALLLIVRASLELYRHPELRTRKHLLRLTIQSLFHLLLGSLAASYYM